MCIQITDEDFVTIHHELGHNYYQRAYNRHSYLHRESANDGFHEGIGDTIALSITPDYLVKVGLLDRVPPAEGDLGQLMKLALDKIASRRQGPADQSGTISYNATELQDEEVCSSRSSLLPP